MSPGASVADQHRPSGLKQQRLCRHGSRGPEVCSHGVGRATPPQGANPGPRGG